MLKPQDLLVALKLAAMRLSHGQDISNPLAGVVDESHRPIGIEWSYRSLAKQLDISVSEISAAIQRGLAARLLIRKDASSRPEPVFRSLREFVVHGVKYVYPAEKGEPTRGIPTAYAAPVLRDKLVDTDELVPVWPYARGSVRGYSLMPIYPSVPIAAARDPVLYDLLALLDAFRAGRARERSIAENLINEILE